MKLNVLKNNSLIGTYDLSSDLAQDPGINFQQVFIGRDNDCHVVLSDPKISRKHAKIVWRDQKYFVEKISSLGGLEVNGQRVSSIQLKNGDVITVDGFALLANEIDTGEKLNENGARVSTAQVVEDLETVSLAQSVAPTPVKEPKEENRTVSFSDFEDTMDDLSKPEDEVEAADVAENDLEFPDADEKNDADEASLNQNIESSFNNDSDMNFSDNDGEDDNFSSDFEGDDDGFAVEGFDDNDKTNIHSSFANFELEISSEHCDYDKYSIQKDEIIIGRDPDKCDIVLDDDEVSSVHVIIKKKNVTCILTDQKSSNGTILNGSRINESHLSNLDEFIVGSTTFTFFIKSDLIESEKNSLMPVDIDQEIEVEEVVEVAMEFGEDNLPQDFDMGGEGLDFSSDAKPVDGKESLVDKFKNLPPKKRMIYMIVGIAAVFMLLGEPEPTKKKKKKKKGDKDYKLKKKGDKKKESIVKTNKYSVENLSEEKKEFLESSYQLAKTLYDQGKYQETILELDKIFLIVPEYKQATQKYDLAKQGLADLEEIEKKKREEIERKIRNKKIKDLVEKAKKATEERKENLAENFFQRIIELDPENFDVPQMRLELENWREDKERKALIEAQKKAERQRKIDALKPGKSYYVRREWYKAILKLEKFLRVKDMDEDLTKEGASMLKEARSNLEQQIKPMIGKARSLKEGQDLKGAFETYGAILKINPGNIESLNNMSEIRDTLEDRSRKVYRDALITESLSKFKEAKQKFQEVQQISPSDSEYYNKATEKLKDYLE